MRVLFLPSITRGSAVGTILRCLAVAEHLRLFGHEAVFLTNGAGARMARQAGFPFMEGVVPDHPGPLRPLWDLSDVAVFLNLTDEEYLRKALNAELEAIDRYKPHVLVSEFNLTASIAAAATDLPLVSTACTPADPRFISPLLPDGRALSHDEATRGFNRILSERGQAPITDVAELFFTRSTLKIAPTIQELEPLLGDVPHLHYVGSLLYDRFELACLPTGLLERARGRHIVFVYLGMGEIGPERYVTVLPAAFDDSEFHAIVAVGEHPDLPKLPADTSNVTWVRSVPGRSMLRCSQALIFHGGQNTAMASLIHGVPSLVFPGSDFERDFNARALVHAEAAIRLPKQDFIAETLLASTRTLLEPAYRLAAERCGWKVVRQGGARHAADLIVKAHDLGSVRDQVDVVEQRG